jgi:hypothetical protein
MTNQDYQDQHDPFELGKMPQLDPPKDLWPGIEAGMDAPARSGMFRWASAASIAAVLIIAAYVVQQPDSELTQPPVANEEPGHLQRLVNVSQKMETRLADYRADGGVMGTDQAGMIAEFEDLIAFIDQQLSDDPGSVDLWFQRVSLMSDLMNVYAVQQSGDIGMIASL